MNTATAGRIYETAREENIAEDLILGLEGLNAEEYKQALKLYLKTIPTKEITMGWEEPEPDKYYCWQGKRIPQWFE
jgi:hypothetical protein